MEWEEEYGERGREVEGRMMKLRRWDGSVERSGRGEKERGKREGGENGGEVWCWSQP